jgi:hypothetical protein
MSGVPLWARAMRDSKRINLLEQPYQEGEDFVLHTLREETRLLIIKYDTLIPVVLHEQRMIYLIHL